VTRRAPAPPDAPVPLAGKGTSLSADAWRRLRRNRFALGGGVLLALIGFACFVLPWMLGLDPNTTSPQDYFQAPCAAHPLGTDALGRDYLARVLIGGRTSLLVGLVATAASMLIGVTYGAVAGYFGGKVDEVMMRLVDFGYAVPYMFLVILITLMFSQEARGSALPVFVGLGLVQWLTMARIVRGEVRALRNREYVLAAEVLGATDGHILLRHILPNILPIVVIYATLTVPAVIILESFLSYLGLGVELSWGQLVAEAVGVVNPIQAYWWLLVGPSVALAATLFCLNFLGDGLRDAIDPRTRS